MEGVSVNAAPVDYWEFYNFDTGEWDSSVLPLTEGIALSMLPEGAARQAFQIRRELGLSIPEALKETLTALVGDRK